MNSPNAFRSFERRIRLRRSLPSRIAAILIGLAAVGCAGPAVEGTPFATFTPMTRFQILSGETNTPIPTASPRPTSTLLPPATATSEPTEEPTPAPPTATDSPPLITLVFTGQIVPARCVQAETDRLGNADYIYEGVRDVIASADIAVGALNAALTDFPPMTGCVQTFVLVGRPMQADAAAAAGFDVMSVATNHIKNCGLTNCGDRAFIDTLDNLRRVGILPVGAGLNHAEAMAPVIVEVSGIRFGFVSLGQIEPLAFAGPETPGIGILTAENLEVAIAAARELSDVVVVLPHWGPEYTHIPNASQRALARAAVEAGADLVVGNHTHYIQAFVEMEGIPVYFGLGNFIFDQNQEPARQQSLILRITFQGTEIVATEMIPAVNETTGRVRIANQDEAILIMTQIQQISAGIQDDLP